ncbi:hypothetical protein D3C86_2198750 [compost metagenome]
MSAIKIGPDVVDILLQYAGLACRIILFGMLLQPVEKVDIGRLQGFDAAFAIVEG